jgi:hypothetical protein
MEELKRFDVVYKKTKSFGFMVMARNEGEAREMADYWMARSRNDFDDDGEDDVVCELHSVTERK